MSPSNVQNRARYAFLKAWNYDFVRSTLIDVNVFGDLRAKMDHAVYASEGVDFSTDVYCPYDNPEEVLRFDQWKYMEARIRNY